MANIMANSEVQWDSDYIYHIVYNYINYNVYNVECVSFFHLVVFFF